MNALDHQHAVFLFDLSSDLRRQLSSTGIDLARFQRTSEGSRQSAARSGHQVVQGRGVGLELLGLDAIMIGYGSMNAKTHRFWFRRQVGQALWTRLAFDSDMRNVNGLRHDDLLQGLMDDNVPQFAIIHS